MALNIECESKLLDHKVLRCDAVYSARWSAISVWDIGTDVPHCTTSHPRHDLTLTQLARYVNFIAWFMKNMSAIWREKGKIMT